MRTINQAKKLISALGKVGANKRRGAWYATMQQNLLKFAEDD